MTDEERHAALVEQVNAEGLTRQIAAVKAAGPAHPLYRLTQPKETRSTMITTTTAAHNHITDLINDAERAEPYTVETDGNGRFQRATPKPHGAIQRHSLRSLAFPALTGPTTHTTYLPGGESAGKASNFSTEIARRSVVMQAGAQAVIIPLGVEPNSPETGNAIRMIQTTTGLITVEPAKFAAAGATSPLQTSALPFNRADIQRAKVPQVGVTFSLPRELQQEYFAGQLPDIILAGLGMGLANAIDAALLGALDAADLAEFSHGAAAAKSISFGALKGIVGTSGTAAEVNQAENLTVKGIRAEYTNQTAATYLAAWDRFGVAIMDEVTLIARKNQAMTGEIDITAWLNLAPLVPASSYAWKVTA